MIPTIITNPLGATAISAFIEIMESAHLALANVRTVVQEITGAMLVLEQEPLHSAGHPTLVARRSFQQAQTNGNVKTVELAVKPVLMPQLAHNVPMDTFCQAPVVKLVNSAAQHAAMPPPA